MIQIRSSTLSGYMLHDPHASIARVHSAVRLRAVRALQIREMERIARSRLRTRIPCFFSHYMYSSERAEPSTGAPRVDRATCELII